MIRSATPADRDALGAMLDRAFGKTAEEDRFLNRFPHLFTEAAIGQHRLAVEDGAILACVGCYRFAATLWGARLEIAGLGQVATAPEARGRSLMTGLLAEAMSAAEGVDLFWLYGDRQRYGRVGFAPGGGTVEGLTWDRYVQAPEPGGIRPLDLASDEALIAAALAARPFALTQDAAERLAMLRGKHATGWTDGGACILLDGQGRTVWAAHGGTDAIARLVGHQVEQHRRRDPKDTGVTLHADPGDAPALAAVLRLAAGITQRPTAQLRVGRLLPLLAAWAAAHPPVPGARLRPTVLDGGAAGRVRIACLDGAWDLTGTDAPADLALAGSGLSELVFGAVPPVAWGLPADSALRRLLPLHFCIPGCYGL